MITHEGGVQGSYHTPPRVIPCIPKSACGIYNLFVAQPGLTGFYLCTAAISPCTVAVLLYCMSMCKAHHTQCNFDATLLRATCMRATCCMQHFHAFNILWRYYSSITEEKMS